MTLREMITRLQVRQANAVFWNDTRTKAVLNDAKDKLAQELRVTTQLLYKFDSVKGQLSYEVPSTFVRHHLLRYGDMDDRITLLNGPEEMTDVTQEGAPSVGYIWGASGRRELFIYPTFDEDGIELRWWFYGWPPDMVGDNDEPAFPVEWHPSLLEIARAIIKEDDGDLAYDAMLGVITLEARKVRAINTQNRVLERKPTYGTIDGAFPNIEDGNMNLRFNDSEGKVKW